MDLSLYFIPIIKWWRLVVIAALIAGVATLVTMIGLSPMYESRTTLIIGQSINDPNPSSAQFYLEQDLAKIYADMAQREPIRNATRAALGLDSLPYYTVRALPNSQLIEIIVRDTDPIRAQTVATELANQMTQRTPTDGGSEDANRERFISEQLSNLQADIEETEEEMTSLEIRLGDTRGALEISDIEDQIAALQNKLRSLQSTFASLILTSQEGALNTLRVFVPADIPNRSINQNPLMSIALASALGAGIAIAGAYLIEYLDRRINHASEITRLLDWPILAQVEQLIGEGNHKLHVVEFPDSSFTNAFRTIRTKIEMAGMGESMKTILVTGPAVAEGKTTVAHNLARIFASGKKKVLLVDADIRKLEGEASEFEGLTDLIVTGGAVTDFVTPTSTPRLSILHAGSRTERSLSMFNLANLEDVIKKLEEHWDIIIIDGPPAFVSDAFIMATKADGFITVVRLGSTKLDAVKEMLIKFDSEDAVPLGIIVNGISGRPTYYRGYYNQEMQTKTRPYWSRQLAEVLNRISRSPGRQEASNTDVNQPKESES
jgi:capsular exopolysaccharide synthesis family protein